MEKTEAVSDNESANFKSVSQFCQDNAVFPKGGVRHMIFLHGPNLIAEGAIHKYGDRIIINQKRWFELLEVGFFSSRKGGVRHEL
jgi:hypothetical protein